MNLIPPFTLTVDDLTSLGQDRAVEFFRRLLWAEASNTGIGRRLVDVPACINVGDGGIDAYIEDAEPSREELIPEGTTGFQIKSTDLSPKECARELHVRNDLTAPIKPEIARILDKRGSYFLVLFADITGEKRNRRKARLRASLEEAGYVDPGADVITANMLVRFAQRNLGLVIWLKSDRASCLPHSAWAGRDDITYPRAYVPNEERKSWTDEFRAILRGHPKDSPVFRIAGLPGIGKTRLVFESLAPDDLSNRVIYANADSFRSSSLHNLLQVDENTEAIVVVDECSLEMHDFFVRAYGGRGERLGLVTIGHDMGRVPPPAKSMRLKPLGRDEIEEIVRQEAPELPSNVYRRISEFSDGYPRIAALLARGYLRVEGPLDEFITIDDDALMERLIGGGGRSTVDLLTTKTVLMGISLFEKLGFEEGLQDEARWLADFLEIDWRAFLSVVEHQRGRGILRGDYYIYVTPFMLRVHLLRGWWEQEGLTKDSFEEFVGSIPEEFRADLMQRFFEHLPFVSTTKRGRAFGKALLSRDGVFADGAMFRSELGASFFLRLSEADPRAALSCLQRTIGAWGKDELAGFTSGRRQVIWALQRIVMWRDLFADGARLLLDLAEAENESWSNNASGVFADLFSPARGQVAPTEASPEERFPVLQEALKATSKERRLLGLEACNRALEAQFFSRTIGAEAQGLRREPDLWAPKTYGEIFDAYRRVWQLLVDELDSMAEDEREKTTTILTQKARGLSRFHNLTEMVADTFRELSQKPYVDKKQLLATVVQILHFEGKQMAPEMLARWKDLREHLTGTGFSAQLRRYVGMDLLVDRFDESGNVVDDAGERINDLAQQAVEDPGLLTPELGWLVTTDDANVFHFGHALGQNDVGHELLDVIFDAFREADHDQGTMFFGGYLRAVFETASTTWETTLQSLAEDERFFRLVPQLTWRSGMTDKAATRVIKLAEKGLVSVDELRVYGLGRTIQEISEPIFQRWVEFLLSSLNPGAAFLALELYHSYYGGKSSKYMYPEKLTLAVLTHPHLFQAEGRQIRSPMDEFHWVQIADHFLQLYPDSSLEIAQTMLEHFGQEGSIVRDFYSQTHSILARIASRHPVKVWRDVAKRLGPPIDSRAFHIKQWLRGGDYFGNERAGALEIFPLGEVLAWVDEAPEDRAWYLASIVPNRLFWAENRVCFAREVLVHFGEREDVQRNLMANFSTEGWSGSASQHLVNKKDTLLEFKSREDDEKVRGWIDAYVAELERRIEQERIMEEREGR